VTERTWQSARIDEIERSGQRRFWVPIRKHFDIRTFGANAWTAQAEGDEISEHTEDSGHEEFYVVTSGHATFTVGSEEIDAPAGTLVFVRDPDTTRAAVAKEAGRRFSPSARSRATIDLRLDLAATRRSSPRAAAARARVKPVGLAS
jgi:hypothetical protein